MCLYESRARQCGLRKSRKRTEPKKEEGSFGKDNRFFLPGPNAFFRHGSSFLHLKKKTLELSLDNRNLTESPRSARHFLPAAIIERRVQIRIQAELQTLRKVPKHQLRGHLPTSQVDPSPSEGCQAMILGSKCQGIFLKRQ